MDHDEAPVLDALEEYLRRRRTPFTPPGHKQGRGADPWVRAVLGEDVFRNDVLASSGLDDRSSSGGVVQRAQELMAELPASGDLELETVMPPRDAFFAATEDVPVEQAVGRICAEQVTPYPPGIPVLLPGERIGAEALDYLRSGVAAGMVLPDPTDPGLTTVRVVAR
jgi:arginine/lysine/ornithine decarboxylase